MDAPLDVATEREENGAGGSIYLFASASLEQVVQVELVHSAVKVFGRVVREPCGFAIVRGYFCEADARKPPMTAAIGFSCFVIGSACTPKFSSAVAPSR